MGLGARGHRALPARALGLQPAIKGISYDPDAGAALLAEAGWTKTQRRRAARQGRQAVRLRAPDQPGQRRAQEGRGDHPGLAAGDRRRRGDPHPRVGGVAEGAHPEAPAFDAIVLGWGIGADPDQFVVWHSSQQRARRAELDRLREPRGRRAARGGPRPPVTQSERVKSYHRLQEVLAEDQPVVFLYFRDALPAIATRDPRHRPRSRPGIALQLHRLVRAPAPAAVHIGLIPRPRPVQ